ncbi:MAG: aspartate aminotransferase family protein, partial [Thermoflexales bacterium]
RELAERLAARPGVRVENDIVLNQIIVSFGNDEKSRSVIRQLQADGVCFAEGAAWRGRWVMRLSLTDAALTQRDVHRLAAAILAAFDAVSAATAPRHLAEALA